uniref:TMEM131_like domain-containing protein n=1 Tax=Enterobius vermicularis TaxID=51028 RepID=A0A0N4UTL8_ENTVE
LTLSLAQIIAAIANANNYFQADSSGTNFLTVFPWNNAPAGSPQQISLNFINVDKRKTASVNVTYYTLNSKETSVKNETRITVSPLNSATFDLPPSCVYQGYKVSELPSIETISNRKIQVVSDSPISVVAHNFYNDSGDSYTILPVSLWKKEYKFSLPPAQRGSHMLYFLSIMEVELHLKVFFGTSKTEFTINLTGEEEAKVYVPSTDSEALTVIVTGSMIFTVIAAVRRLPISNSNGRSDFGCFIPSSAFSSHLLHGTYVTTLDTATYYSFTPANFSKDKFEVNVEGGSNMKEVLHLKANGSQMPQHISQSYYGDIVAFQES